MLKLHNKNMYYREKKDIGDEPGALYDAIYVANSDVLEFEGEDEW